MLKGDLFVPKNEKKKSPAILFVPGWKSQRKSYIEYAKMLTELGYICMTFDLSGHGESDGDINKISRKEFLNDLIFAYDQLASQRGVDKDTIHIIASSFGCYLASILLSKRKVKSIVLRVPQNYPDKGFDEAKVLLQGDELIDWRSRVKEPGETKSLGSLNNYDGTVLIIEAENDEYVTKQTIENYKNAVKNKENLYFEFAESMRHSFRSEEERKFYMEILKKWFIKQV